METLMILGFLLIGYMWVAKVNLVDYVQAADPNDLQAEKLDRDGEIPATGVQQWDKGGDVVSANPLVLGNDGNYFDVTGVAGFAAINQLAVGGASVQAGTIIKLHFDAALLITHSANLVLPGGANITTAANDEAEFTCFDTNKWRCTNYIRASGLPIINPPGFYEGMIIAFSGGYMTNGSNGGFTNVLANTVADVNALFNPRGFYVMDGSALNLGALSTIYNGANRYLENLTDSRFLMGSNVAGGTGGNNAMAHTHDVDIAAFNSVAEAAHTHGTGSYAVASHAHGTGSYAVGSHTHGVGSYAVGAHYHISAVSHVPSGNLVYVTHAWGYTAVTTPSHTRYTCVSHEDRGEQTDNWDNTSLTTPSFGGTSGAATPGFGGNSGAATPGFGGTSGVGSSHLHSIDPPNTTSGGASNTENRPAYLSCFYLKYCLK